MKSGKIVGSIIAFREWSIPKKTAESTGRFPPTPVPKAAIKDASVTKSGDPPAARPNTPAISRVKLNDHLSNVDQTTV